MGTWHSPDARTVNEIDHVMVEEKFKNVIKDVRVYRGAEMNSDHMLARINMIANFKKGVGIVRRVKQK